MGYYVYQNGVKLPYVCLPDCPEIIVEDVPDGNYTYYVTAMVADSLTEVESPPSNEVEVIVNCVLDPPPAPVIGQPQVTCP